MRFFIATLGCKINQYESQALREAWQEQGLIETQNPEEAGLVLVNSCAVTARAVRDLRHTVRRLHRLAPEAGIIVTGCAAEHLAEELAAMPGVRSVVPQKDKPTLRSPSPPPHGGGHTPLRIADFQRSRAVLKVQDGCSHRCTYCIVPLTRGPAVSRPPEDVLAEARRLLQSGLRELVVSGINLRQYRYEGRDFWDLLAFLDRELAPEWSGRARLRCSSLDPAQLDARGLETIAHCRLLCPHLHLSIQSGCFTVLQRMGRGHYRPEDVLGGLASLKRHLPLLGLGADLLVGFPGESEAEFAATLEFCQALPLSYAHVFPYSRRPGTSAARMPGQVAKPLRAERAAKLRELAESKRRSYALRLADLPRLQVLLESSVPAGGRCEYYVPCRLEHPLPHVPVRSIIVTKPVLPATVEEDALLVRPLEAVP